MKEISIHRADSIRTEDQVRPVVIRIDKSMPGFESPDGTYECFKADGEALAEALWAVLPGGTVDALLGQLLTRSASKLRVRFPQKES